MGYRKQPTRRLARRVTRNKSQDKKWKKLASKTVKVILNVDTTSGDNFECSRECEKKIQHRKQSLHPPVEFMQSVISAKIKSQIARRAKHSKSKSNISSRRNSPAHKNPQNSQSPRGRVRRECRKSNVTLLDNKIKKNQR
jgi:transcription elongation factor Elf1